MKAVIYGDEASVSCLLTAGANVGLVDREKRSADDQVPGDYACGASVRSVSHHWHTATATGSFNAFGCVLAWPKCDRSD